MMYLLLCFGGYLLGGLFTACLFVYLSNDLNINEYKKQDDNNFGFFTIGFWPLVLPVLLIVEVVHLITKLFDWVRSLK